MKKCEKFMRLNSWWFLRELSAFAPRIRPSTFGDRRTFLARLFLWCHAQAGAGALQAVDDDFFVPLQSGANDSLAVNDRAEFYGPILDRVRRSEREHKLLRLVRSD